MPRPPLNELKLYEEEGKEEKGEEEEGEEAVEVTGGLCSSEDEHKHAPSPSGLVLGSLCAGS